MEDFIPNESVEPPPNVPSDALADALVKLIDERERGQAGHFSAGERAGNAPRPESRCPAPGEWIHLADGETEGAESEDLLSHAAHCRPCAEKLALSVQMHSKQVTPEEEIAVGRMASSTIAWQRKLAARLAKTPRSRASSTPAWRYVWGGTGIAAALLVAGALALWWQHVNSPELMLARVYGHTRAFALRLPGAGYAPETPGVHLRGGSSGREPAELLDARARIERHLERAQEDPHWLQLEARADVLEENFDPAVDILDRLLASGPPPADLLADAAMAYFQRGAATGSENDRATALDYLHRAEELAPGDPVVLFNEAVVMEDRGQLMNAIETWRRFLRFERDPAWLSEGRAHLADLEKKLDRMKTHQSRMEQHLASPQAMRALAGDETALAAVDEELSTTLLPQLLYIAYPPPLERSRGSPCADPCQAARALLQALAASLERNHHDLWLTQFLPAESAEISDKFKLATQSLGQAIDADQIGDFPAAARSAAVAGELFRSTGNAAGEGRAAVESAYALQRSFHLAACRETVRPLLGRAAPFAWIETTAAMQNAVCDTGPGTASEDTSVYERLAGLAHDHGYALLELRAWTMSAGSAMESGDTEETWRIDLAAIRRFYTGDYPPFRLMNLVYGPALVEAGTPRAHLDLLLAQEYVEAMELTESRETLPSARMWLAAAAIRAGNVTIAGEQMQRAQSEFASSSEVKPFQAMKADNEIALANFDLENGRFAKTAHRLEAAQELLAGDDSFVHRREYAALSGQLELALGHPEAAEAALHDAILDEERQAGDAGRGNVIFAREDRDLYAVLAGVWLALHRSPEDVLALWERYRLRILGLPVPACAGNQLDCLKPALLKALDRLGEDKVAGEIVLPDRVLSYQGDGRGISFSSAPCKSSDLLAAAAELERAASSPATSRESVGQAERRIGEALFRETGNLPDGSAQLLLEPDPLLGNLPWPAVDIGGQPAGLQFNLVETPSLLLPPRRERLHERGTGALVVGASMAAGGAAPLPEALSEARDVARFMHDPRLLVGDNAIESQVAAAMPAAAAIHFAGHAVQRNGSTRLLLAGSAASEAKPYLDSELFRRHPPAGAQLAVFSACSSGKREEGWNHGMGDIVDTLAALGVPEVVATRWQIDSAAAVPMMDAFYSGLSEGLRVPAALTRARLSLSRDPRYWHPYYWGSYYASGTGNTDLREVIHGSDRQHDFAAGRGARRDLGDSAQRRRQQEHHRS